MATMLPMVKRASKWLVVFVVLAAGFWFALPTYRHWKERNSVRQAREFFNKGDYPNATLSARRARAINPRNVEACRIMAEVGELFHALDALDWRASALEAQPDDFTNQLDYVR